MKTIPATMTEAKLRFRSHTKGVLTNKAKRDVKETGTWKMIESWPCLISANYAFKFRKDSETGHVWCEYA